MKIKNIISGIFILTVLTQVVLAASIKIDMKNSFGFSEEISFNFSITSNSLEEITYISSVDCPISPLPLLELKNGTTPIKETYTYLTVKESTEPQTCKAFVLIIEPYELTEEKNFSIIANPSFDFQILTCRDESCTNQTRVFVFRENIYFDYESEVSNPIVTASLTYPNKNIEQLNLPGSIKAEQIGTYELEVNASKQGYKTITKKIQFGVIEKEAQINYVNLQDLKSLKQREKTLKNISYLFIAGLIVIILIVLFVLFKKIILRKKKS